MRRSRPGERRRQSRQSQPLPGGKKSASPPMCEQSWTNLGALRDETRWSVGSLRSWSASSPGNFPG